MAFRTFLFLLSLYSMMLTPNVMAQTADEANPCAESEHQSDLRTELAKVYGLKRHIAPVPPAIWALETMDTPKHCEVSCRNNTPYDTLYLTYKGFEASGKACEGETGVVMSAQGLVKLIASCMAGCRSVATAPSPDK